MPQSVTRKSDQNIMLNPDRPEMYQEINGEFKIERGFAGMEKAQAF